MTFLSTGNQFKHCSNHLNAAYYNQMLCTEYIFLVYTLYSTEQFCPDFKDDNNKNLCQLLIQHKYNI